MYSYQQADQPATADNPTTGSPARWTRASSRLLSPNERVRYLGQKRMTVEEFAAIPPNPIQRDTERRAAGAHHLDVFEPKHAMVEMAMLPDGSLYKIDGHTRCFRWLSGDVKGAPSHVIVNIWAVRDIEDIKRLYEQTDNASAAENTADRLAGGERAAELNFQSSLLRRRQYADALRLLDNLVMGEGKNKLKTAIDTAEIVARYKDELFLLDKLNPPKPRFPAGIMAAALACFLADGERAATFWTLYANDQGRKSQKAMDAVQALSHALHSESNSRGSGPKFNLFRKALQAYQAWGEGRNYVLQSHDAEGKPSGKAPGLRGVEMAKARDYVRRAYRSRHSGKLL